MVFLTLYQEFGRTSTVLMIMVNLPLALSGGLLVLYLFLGGELNVAELDGLITLLSKILSIKTIKNPT